MKDRLLISLDGHLTVVEQFASDIHVALTILRNANPECSVVLVKVLPTVSTTRQETFDHGYQGTSQAYQL